MKRLIVAAALCGIIGLLTHPRIASREETVIHSCLREAVRLCDEDLDLNDGLSVAVRGWCYAIRSAFCLS
jgi:hypothetical protein